MSGQNKCSALGGGGGQRVSRQQETFQAESLPQTLTCTYSKCSIKGGNLRELTRWLELPGNPPIGTFLPVYDLLHTHTGCRA